MTHLAYMCLPENIYHMFEPKTHLLVEWLGLGDLCFFDEANMGRQPHSSNFIAEISK